MANASNQPKQWRGWSTNRFLETSATFPGMALLNGAKRGIPISSLRRNTEEQERKKKRKERNKKKKKKKSSNPSRDFLSPRRATIHGQRSPADPLPFEFLRLPSVNATGNYHSRHCRPLLSRLRIIIVLCGESSKSKRKKKKKQRKKKGSFIVDQDVGSRENGHELFSEIDSFGKSRPRLRVIRVFATGFLSFFLCLSLALSVCPRIN